MISIPDDIARRFDDDISHKEKRRFMLQAIKEAQKGMLKPRVGAVIVVGEKIVARGHYHQVQEGYRLHAEEYVLAKVDKSKLKNSVLYCTLEPCSYRSTGKEGCLPCSRLIAKSDVPKVVVGLISDDPKVNGRGIRILLEAGKSVELGHEGLEDKLMELVE